MHSKAHESSKPIIPKVPRPPKIFARPSSGQPMIRNKTNVRPMHEGGHKMSGYGRRNPEHDLERRQSRPEGRQSRPGTLSVPSLDND